MKNREWKNHKNLKFWDKRLIWAKQHQDFDWNRVILTDKTTFRLNQSLGKMWQLPGQRKIRHTVKYPLNLIVWEAFSSKGFGKIICFSQNLDANFLLQIYENDLLPTAYDQFWRHSSKWILQEDNNPKHMSNVAPKNGEATTMPIVWSGCQCPQNLTL